MKKNIWLMLIFPIAFLYGQHNSGVNADEALQRLIDGNKRFVENQIASKTYLDEVKETSKGQHPYAVILTCSDSRLPAEIIFDESIGKLFVVRVAGNVIDPITLGSIEYAVEHLGTSYVLVLGHTACGAVNATYDGGHFTPSIQELAKLILPAVDTAKKHGGTKEEQILNAINENVLLQIKSTIKHSHVVEEFLHEKKLKLEGAIYDVSTGKVEFLK
jgi:carbonic anhydrase